MHVSSVILGFSATMQQRVRVGPCPTRCYGDRIPRGRRERRAHLADYDNGDNAERRRIDLAMRRVAGDRAKERQTASISKLNRFETEKPALRAH